MGQQRHPSLTCDITNLWPHSVTCDLTHWSVTSLSYNIPKWPLISLTCDLIHWPVMSLTCDLTHRPVTSLTDLWPHSLTCDLTHWPVISVQEPAEGEADTLVDVHMLRRRQSLVELGEDGGEHRLQATHPKVQLSVDAVQAVLPECFDHVPYVHLVYCHHTMCTYRYIEVYVVQSYMCIHTYIHIYIYIYIYIYIHTHTHTNTL